MNWNNYKNTDVINGLVRNNFIADNEDRAFGVVYDARCVRAKQEVCNALTMGADDDEVGVCFLRRFQDIAVNFAIGY